MKFRIETVFGVIATVLAIAAPRAIAQDPTSYENRADQRAAANELKACESAPIKSAQQILEDLNHLQALAQHLSNIGNEPDLRAIAKSAGEIRQAAVGLSSELALTKPESNTALKEIELPIDRPQLKLMISALFFLVGNTARNVMMQDDAIDVTGRAQLRSDLDAIVELSSRINIESKLMNKDE